MLTSLRNRLHRTTKPARPALECLEDRSVPTCSFAMQGVFMEGTTLCAVGGDADDSVSVIRAGDEVRVYSTLLPGMSYLAVPADEVQAIEIYLADGNDTASVRPEVNVPALMYTGAGNDWLTGGSGNDYLDAGWGDDVVGGGNGHDIVLGGDGNDWIDGNAGRDVVIGGMGSDFVLGQGEDDLLVGGATAYDEDSVALEAIRAEWTSDHDYMTRVMNIHDGTGSVDRGNESYFLDDSTVADDGAVDYLQGSSGQDWFILSASDQVTDADGAEVTQVQ